MPGELVRTLTQATDCELLEFSDSYMVRWPDRYPSFNSVGNKVTTKAGQVRLFDLEDFDFVEVIHSFSQAVLRD